MHLCSGKFLHFYTAVKIVVSFLLALSHSVTHWTFIELNYFNVRPQSCSRALIQSVKIKVLCWVFSASVQRVSCRVLQLISWSAKKVNQKFVRKFVRKEVNLIFFRKEVNQKSQFVFFPGAAARHWQSIENCGFLILAKTHWLFLSWSWKTWWLFL